MPDAPTPRRSYGDGRRALLAAAVEVGAERGLRGLTLRAVAERAGVNNALIVHHFGGREGLLEAALDWSSERSIVDVDLGIADARPAQFIAELVDQVEARPEHLIFQYEMILESTRRAEHRTAVQRLYANFFSGLATPGDDPDPALTRARFAAIDGLVLQTLSGAISLDDFTASLHATLDVAR